MSHFDPLKTPVKPSASKSDSSRPFAAAILAPSIPQILDDFHQPTQLSLGDFAVSTYTLGFAIGPLLLSPLSELYGRLIIYHICGVLYVFFTVGGALATSLNMLIGFRFLAGCAGSAPLTIGGGSIADMMGPEKRGAAMSIQAFGGMMGPAIGPVAGAFLSQSKGWRWVLWLVTILVRPGKQPTIHYELLILLP